MRKELIFGPIMVWKAVQLQLEIAENSFHQTLESFMRQSEQESRVMMKSERGERKLETESGTDTQHTHIETKGESRVMNMICSHNSPTCLTTRLPTGLWSHGLPPHSTAEQQEQRWSKAQDGAEHGHEPQLNLVASSILDATSRGLIPNVRTPAPDPGSFSGSADVSPRLESSSSAINGLERHASSK